MGFNLSKINLSIRKGEFIALIGEFGAGKSSIINAVLGEMNNESSRVAINGSIAYASQAPWILNDTVKNNIVFGETLDDQRYMKAIHYSRLETDLDLFTHGDATVIGERGSTLSGGQRARISLARALYREADIYIFDDIFSALDAHVSAFIFQETLVKHLKGRTIILATHLVNYLNLVDRVFLIDDGRIEELKQMKESIGEVIIIRKRSSVRRGSRDSSFVSPGISEAVYSLKVPESSFPFTAVE
jgi:ATP-binding cassette subfamily C (CFTR/MRP) protein 4